MSTINVIKNPKFEEGLNGWFAKGTYDGNTIEIKPSAGVSGNSARLSVPEELGMTYICQRVNLLPGNYEVSFMAKKVSGNADVWIGVNVNGGFKYSPSFLPKMSTKYTNLSYAFSVGGNNRTTVTIYLNAGSIPGVVDFDNVSLLAEDENDMLLNTLYYADVNVNSEGVKVRAKIPNGTILGHWQKGRRAVIERVKDNDEWVRCRWKNKYAYVQKSFLTNIRRVPDTDYEAILKDVMEDEMEKAASHAIKYYYKNEKYTDQWCHMFADWLAGHCAWESGAYIPTVSGCKQGVKNFLENNRFKFVNSQHKAEIYNNVSDIKQFMDGESLDPYEESFVPEIGDYIYLRKCNGDKGYKSNLTSYHVGIVKEVKVENGGVSIVAMEGNTDAEGNIDGVGYVPYIYKNEGNEKQGRRYQKNILGFGETVVNG